MRRWWEELVIDFHDRMDGFVAAAHRGRLDHDEHELAVGWALAKFSTNLVSTFKGTERRAEKFRLIAYPTARGCAAAYFPEANVLVHSDLVARESNTPGYKAMTVRFEPHQAPQLS